MHLRFPPAGVLPLRASPAALVPRAVAVPALGNQPRTTPRAWASSRATGCGLSTPWGAIREVADLYYGIKEGTINANHAWWYPEMDHAGARLRARRHQLHHGQVRPVLDLRRLASCAATRWSSTRPRRRTRRSATPCRATRDGNERHHQRQRPAPEGMVGQRPAPGRLEGGAHLRERRMPEGLQHWI